VSLARGREINKFAHGGTALASGQGEKGVDQVVGVFDREPHAFGNCFELAGERSNFASVTSMAVRIAVSGVRSSCEALAMKAR